MQQRDPGPDEDRSLSFDALVVKYHGKIYNLIYHQVGDPEDAADLTQETFVNAFKAFSRFRGESKVYTWLCQIALNACKNRFRQRARLKPFIGPSLDEPLGDSPDAAGREIPDWTYAPDRALERQELQERVRRAIYSLPPDYRWIIIMRDLQDLTYQEIAQATGLSLEAVKTRLHRGRLMLRRKLEPYVKG